MSEPTYGSFTVADERTGASWTMTPSRLKRGRINVIVTGPRREVVEEAVQAFSREYHLTMLGHPIPRRWPRPQGWIAVMQMQYADVVNLRS